MNISIKYTCLFFLIFQFQFSDAQHTESIWRETPSSRIVKSEGKRPIQPEKYVLYQVDFELLKSQLNHIQEDSTSKQGSLVSIPSPYGANAPFVGVGGKQNAEITLPTNVDGTNYRLAWGWSNSVTNPTGVAGTAFEIDNVKVTEGTPGIRIETEVTTVSDEQYLGPFQSIYFHDPSDEKLLLYIQNTSAHDYGCTTVEVDRAGNGATEFQFVNPMLDVTDKSYRVLPTNNNPNGTYAITLYYTEDEIAGWEAATGNNRADLQIVKSVGAISAVTPINPQIPTTFYKDAVLGSFGSDITLTSTYDNGFSGFAAGITENPLPIELISFDATEVDNRYVDLDWITATEVNNDFFTIERTVNGVDWEAIEIVDGAGNSSVWHSYATKDLSPYGGISYYRLKQTDFDGNYAYSNAVSVRFEESSVLIYPNIATESFTVESSKSELSEVKIFNTFGQDVSSLIEMERKSDTKVVLKVARLSSGMYYVQTKTATNKVCKK